jgi:hypothetical protein
LKSPKTADKNKKCVPVKHTETSKDVDKMIAFRIVGAYNHAADKLPFAVCIAKDLSKPEVWLWGSTRLRWNSEVLFRDLKQNFA